MGMEYDLFKQSKKERFELGKGIMWSNVFKYDYGIDFTLAQLVNNPTELYQRLLETVACEFSWDTKLQYFYDLALELYTWCGDDKIQFHSQDSFNGLYWDTKYTTYDIYKVKFPYTGSRYNV
jgi:hypothetical protein